MIVSEAGPSDRVPPYRFALRTRVEITDTDLGEVVYYGRYSTLLDRAIIAYRRHLGIPPLGPEGHMFMVRRMEVDYRSSARFDDLLDIHVRTVEVGRASHVVEGRVDAVDGESRRHLIDARVVLVGVRPTDPPRPSPMPPEMSEALRAFESL